MRGKLILVVGFLVLSVFVAVPNAESSLIVTTANDSISLTNLPVQYYTDTVMGTQTNSFSSQDASGFLTVSRSSSSLDYVWAATPDFPNTLGVGIVVTEDFTLSDPADFQLAFTGGDYLNGYLMNVDTGTYLEKFGYKSGNTGPQTPPFTLSGSVPAGHYELLGNMGALPNFGFKSGEISLNFVPEPSTLVLLAIGAISLLGWAWRRRAA